MGMSHVIPEQMQKAYSAKIGESIEVFSVDHTRSFCFVDDAIEMLVRMLENNSCEGLTLNLGSESPEISILDLVKECHKLLNKELAIIPKKGPQGSPRRRAPDMKKTAKILGYESRINLSDGLLETYNWYKENIFNNETYRAL